LLVQQVGAFHLALAFTKLLYCLATIIFQQTFIFQRASRM
jgi:hypothetical protein